MIFLQLSLSEDLFTGRILSKKYMGVPGYFLKKRKLSTRNLSKQRKQPLIVILQQAIFYNIFILCLGLRIIRRSDQGVQFLNFPSQIFFNDINHDYRGAILRKKIFVTAFILYGCSYLFLLRKGAQNDAYCKCITPP